MFPEMTIDQVDRVVDALAEFFIGERRAVQVAGDSTRGARLAHASRVGST
jgi:hypothetical protein